MASISTADPTKLDKEFLTSIWDYKDLDEIKSLVKARANINYQDYGRSALHLAVDKELLEFLINQKANINAENVYKNTPLLDACMLNQPDKVKLLLAAKADPNISDGFGQVPLAVSILTRNDEIFSLLLNLTKPSMIDKELLCHARSAYVLRALIQYLGVDVNKDKVMGESLLIRSVRSMPLECVQALYELGARLESKDAFKRTPLFKAAELGRKDIVEYLTKVKANPNVANDFGRTPLHSTNSHTCAELLIAAKAAIDVTDSNGNTPLMLSLLRNNIEMFKTLVDSGANYQLIQIESVDVSKLSSELYNLLIEEQSDQPKARMLLDQPLLVYENFLQDKR